MHGISTDIMLGVIALHLVGVLMSSILNRENLVRSMFTGLKRVPGTKVFRIRRVGRRCPAFL